MATINTSYMVFLVSFHGVSKQFIFTSGAEVLGNLIAEHGQHGILFIKRFQSHKSNFVKISKEEIQNIWSWDTHTTEQLKKINFIK